MPCHHPGGKASAHDPAVPAQRAAVPYMQAGTGAGCEIALVPPTSRLHACRKSRSNHVIKKAKKKRLSLKRGAAAQALMLKQPACKHPHLSQLAKPPKSKKKGKKKGAASIVTPEQGGRALMRLCEQQQAQPASQQPVGGRHGAGGQGQAAAAGTPRVHGSAGGGTEALSMARSVASTPMQQDVSATCSAAPSAPSVSAKAPGSHTRRHLYSAAVALVSEHVAKLERDGVTGAGRRRLCLGEVGLALQHRGLWPVRGLGRLRTLLKAEPRLQVTREGTSAYVALAAIAAALPAPAQASVVPAAGSDTCQRVQALLGYTFANPQLLQDVLALACKGQSWARGRARAFVGDSALALCVSASLLHANPNLTNGQMEKARQKVVSNAALAVTAKEVGLEAILNGLSGKKQRGLTGPQLATILEALFGAVYEDAQAAGRPLQECMQCIQGVLEQRKKSGA